jgi:predicted patatin/cPLA2 family phospholipase
MPGELLGPQHVGSTGPVLEHPTVETMAERHASGSQRGERDDGHVIAVAVEGGGIAGAVSAAMAVTMEATGLVDTVDGFYGTSSGVLNSLWTAAGKAALGATNYPDIMVPEFATTKHLLKGEPIINFNYLFEYVIGEKKPLELAELDGGPELAAVSVNVDTGEAELLKDFESTEELMLAVRASCAMPFLSGFPVEFRGARMTDGAMRASVPFRLALEDGASHVLALRTRGAHYRKDPYRAFEIYAPLLAGGRKLSRLVRERTVLYNADADELQYGRSQTVVQIAPEGPDDEPVAQMEMSVPRMREGFRLGAAAMAKAFGMPEIDVDWDQYPPVVVTKAA